MQHIKSSDANLSKSIYTEITKIDLSVQLHLDYFGLICFCLFGFFLYNNIQIAIWIL